jgi:hypothetical protein
MQFGVNENLADWERRRALPVRKLIKQRPAAQHIS